SFLLASGPSARSESTREDALSDASLRVHNLRDAARDDYLPGDFGAVLQQPPTVRRSRRPGRGRGRDRIEDRDRRLPAPVAQAYARAASDSAISAGRGYCLARRIQARA